MTVSAHVETVCKIGQGAECCRYLVGGRRGFECAKGDRALRRHLDNRVTLRQIVARGDNCEGKEDLS